LSIVDSFRLPAMQDASEDRNWVEIRVPGPNLFWVESYYPAVDALLAIPLFERSDAAKKALERGIIREISLEQAQELNKSFANCGPWAATYLQDILDERWKIIAMVASKVTA
jgi:hypothetical protein